MPPQGKGSEFALRALRRVSQAQALKRAAGDDRKGPTSDRPKGQPRGRTPGSAQSQPLLSNSQSQQQQHPNNNNNNYNSYSGSQGQGQSQQSSNNNCFSTSGMSNMNNMSGMCGGPFQGGRQQGGGCSQGYEPGFSDSQGNCGGFSQSQTFAGEPSWEKGGWNSSLSTQTPSNLGPSEPSQSASQSLSSQPLWQTPSQPSFSQPTPPPAPAPLSQPLFGMHLQQQQQPQSQQQHAHYPPQQQHLQQQQQQRHQQQQQQQLHAMPAQPVSQQPAWMSQPLLEGVSSQGYAYPSTHQRSQGQTSSQGHYREEAGPPFALPESQGYSSQPASQDAQPPRWAVETIPGSTGYNMPMSQPHMASRGVEASDESSTAVAKAAAALVAALGRSQGPGLPGEETGEPPKRRRLRQKGPDPQAHLYRPPSPVTRVSEWTERRKAAVTSLDRKGKEAFSRHSTSAVDASLAALKKHLQTSAQDVIKSASAAHEGSEEVLGLLDELESAVAENDRVLDEVFASLTEALATVPTPNSVAPSAGGPLSSTATPAPPAAPRSLIAGPTLGLGGMRRRRIDGVTAGFTAGGR